jgi:hypothetical protein
MGFPRDICHAVSLTGSCSGGIIGNGKWDIDAFFRVNYNWNQSQWMANTSDENGNPLAATVADIPTVSRYDVYMWEMRNPATTIDTPRTVSGTSLKSYSSPICRGSVTPSATVPDRRRISVAVVNCKAQDLKGAATNVQVLKWVDVFLVEPAIQRPATGQPNRSRNGDIYAEVIGVTASGGSANNAVTRRDVPYLIR